MGTPTFSLYYELLEPISFLRFGDKFLSNMYYNHNILKYIILYSN
ncbi:hypothetical protein LEP1GSC055_1571 [Leptospira borgpetersenii str. Brem 307]|uniref:Uncharacterized protein n=1 Tax=Leptospira borgpetersenii str. Brem 328 TaxID=1049780 RepID=A0ABC9SHE3_LEPBO|nr:hypothetical protein LEP1GSC055_1571 [Leptospira borgpetersenii str. Brem 307]EMN17126.1 hypothetical protein LEP1GSC056_1454 [Leptospira borgpetersenii str. Brem 328]